MTTIERIAQRAREVRAQAGDGRALPSPCVSVCQMDALSGLCAGCLRTLAEIAEWGAMDEGGKRVVWQRIEQRSLTGASR